jgi:predicted regulator of Ras-like GTPase activity (Roadblock/LC7/MglB family)
MFREHLQKIVESVDGGQAALLMGFDGIAVESYTPKDVDFDPDIGTVGMEFSFIFGQIRKAAEILEIGEIREVTIKSSALIIVIRQLTDEYFTAVTLSPDGNFGKARFLLRITAPRILQDL